MLRAHQGGSLTGVESDKYLGERPHDAPVVRVANWHTATGSKSETVLSFHYGPRCSNAGCVLYRAPEFGLDRANPVSIDVFSLGALATLIFTGHACREHCRSQRSDDGSGLCRLELLEWSTHHLSDVIALATKSDPSARRRCADAA